MRAPRSKLNRIFPDVSETIGSVHLLAKRLGEDYPVEPTVVRIVAM